MEVIVGIISFIFGWVVCDKYRALKTPMVEEEDDALRQLREREEEQWGKLFSYTEKDAVRGRDE